GWMMKVFPLLSALKGLRGSAFDIFAHTLERKLERADIDNYLKMLEKIKGGLTKENYEIGRELCESVAILRGFGPVKAENRQKVAGQQADLLKKFVSRGRSQG
ncbi:MAG: hypothetical protein OEY09_16520, partial [Gammaproteobacteria bacterium]|nr:hypothetical protein [Gammaproteobacteria bacterium]